MIPTEEASAEVAREVGMSGPSSRGSSDTVSPTVITLPEQGLPQGGRRNRLRRQVRAGQASPSGRRNTVTGATRTVVSSRSPALDSVTSSSRAVPAGVPDGAMPATAVVVREPVSETASHSRMPSAAMASGCSRTTPRRESSAEVFSRAVKLSCVLGVGRLGHVESSHVRSPACAAPVAPWTGGCGGAAPAGSPVAPRAVGVACRPRPPDAPPGSACVRMANGM